MMGVYACHLYMVGHFPQGVVQEMRFTLPASCFLLPSCRLLLRLGKSVLPYSCTRLNSSAATAAGLGVCWESMATCTRMYCTVARDSY
jgi:hypothetical protein